MGQPYNDLRDEAPNEGSPFRQPTLVRDHPQVLGVGVAGLHVV